MDNPTFVIAAGRALTLGQFPPGRYPQVLCPACTFVMILSPYSGALECMSCALCLYCSAEETRQLGDILGFRWDLIFPTVAHRPTLDRAPVGVRLRVWRLLTGGLARLLAGPRS